MTDTAEEHFALFETARGTAGIAWTLRGIKQIQLPEATAEVTRARLQRGRSFSVEASAEGAIAEAIEQLQAHLAGTPQSLTNLRLDLAEVTPFRRLIYTALRDVSVGEVVSYGELADQVGSPGAARAVGNAMAVNPLPLVVPCHRVLAAGRRIGGFSAHGGAQTKVDLLALEGVTLPGSALGLSFDPLEATEAIAADEPAMARVIERAGPMRLLVDPLESPFVALTKAIIYQQLTGKAAATIYGRLEALFGGELPPPETIRDAKEEALRSVGISRAKAAGLKDLAAKTVDGVVPSVRALRAMDDEAIVRRLTTVRGIGRWTVEMLLIFRLGRPDVFPVDDYGVRKGLAALAGDSVVPKPRAAAEAGKRWRPFRTAASWYCWRAGEIGAELLWQDRSAAPTS